ncbi:hypothetical protein EMN47_03110 [Prolixibacteraceae bacterium JC049]|nr:hypothetical protein [Prolixibacteraceae bacterium JC049]
MSNYPKTEHERMLFADGYRLGLSVIENGFNKEKLFDAQRRMYENIDALIESLLQHARKQNIAIDCKARCEFCCHQAVFANSVEIDYLARHIKKQLPNNQQRTIAKKAKQKYQLTEQLGSKAVLNLKHKCPLLFDGKCTAYEARPMACRIYLSMKLSTCQRFFEQPDDKNNYPALLEFPLMAGRMMNEGFLAALKTENIECAELKLEHGLNIELNQPEMKITHDSKK